MPRGYYCPSKIIDVISNAKRGKLTKRKVYDFIYNFDENGKLIFVRRSNAKACEFIKWIDNFEIGITFRRRNRIEAISICEFYEDGKIKQYSYYYRDSIYDKNMKLEREIYEYDNNSTGVRLLRFIPKDLNPLGEEIFSEQKYLFSKINEKEYQYVCEQLYLRILSAPSISYHIHGMYPFE